MNPTRRRPRSSDDVMRAMFGNPPRERVALRRATGLRILAFKQAPPGTSSAEFNRGTRP